MIARLDGPEPVDSRQKWRVYAMMLVMGLPALAVTAIGAIASDRLTSYTAPLTVPSWVTPTILSDRTLFGWAAAAIVAFLVLFWSVGQGLYRLSGPGYPTSERVAWGQAQGMALETLLLGDEKAVAIALPNLYRCKFADAVLPLLLLPWALISLVRVGILTVMVGPAPLADVDRLLVAVAVVSAIYVVSTASPEGRQALCLLPLCMLKLVGMVTDQRAAAPGPWAQWLPWVCWLPVLVCAPRILRGPPLRGLLVTSRRLVGLPWWLSIGANPSRRTTGRPRTRAWLAARFPPPTATSGSVTFARADGVLRVIVHGDTLVNRRLELEPDDLPSLREAVRDAGLPFDFQDEPDHLVAPVQQARRLGPTAALLAFAWIAALDLGKSTGSTLALTQVAQPVLRAAEAGDATPYDAWHDPLVRTRPDDSICLAILGHSAEALHRPDDAVALYRRVDGLQHAKGKVGRFAAARLATLNRAPGTGPPVPGAP